MAKHIINNYNFLPAKRSLFRSMSIRKRKFLNHSKSYSAYLSIDGVAEIADYYAFGKSGKEFINVKRAGETRVLFVNSDLLEKVEYDLFPKLKVIISGNSDRNFYKTPDFPSSVNLVLLQNCSIISDRVKLLPIGLENRRTGRYNADNVFYKKTLSKTSFSPKILVPPMSDTNSLRSIVISQASKFPKYFDVQTQYLHELEYFSLISKYNFLLCLEGNGFDTHRIWEAMYLGVFPVMFRTKWASALETLKLPILFIEDLSDISENKLSEFWQSNSKLTPAAIPQLWLEYWHKLIRTSALDSQVTL